MGRHGKQYPRLVQQLLAALTVPHQADLQGDEAAVLAIQRLDHMPLAAHAQRLEQLVALLDQRQHRPALFHIPYTVSYPCHVSPQVEVIFGVRSWRLSLDGDRTTVGKAAENDVALDEDPTASHLHAILERFPAGWCVTDLGSSNGTWVNGERIWAPCRLRPGDEIRVGQTRLIFRDPLSASGSVTEAEDGPPSLTPREHDVLLALAARCSTATFSPSRRPPGRSRRRW